MNTASSQLKALGGVRQDAIDAVVAAGASALSVADAGTKEAFLDAWTRTLSAHARLLRAKGEQLSAPVVLVHVDNCADVGGSLGWARRPMLGGAPTDSLAGILAVGTAEVGAYMKPDRLQDTESMTQAIEQAGLGARLTVALMSTSQLIIWPYGLDGEMKPFLRELDDSPVVMNLDVLDRNLSQFYEEAARQSRTWWKDRSQRITVEKPEDTVQNDLWLFLLGKYADRAKVKRETVIGHGRADITLSPTLQQDASAVLELKVTRDVRTPKPGTINLTAISLQENITWARSGVQQTAAYRDDEGFDGAYLCVYDFCAGNRQEIENGIQEAAKPHNVYARRYWITQSHEEHREERYPLSVADAGDATGT
ncbi:hypothetical protein LH447_10495 [Laribacter hongkongensis]|uniref:hypothetical protein n=1 Tax=Laribacter hongkongensis TaxID=168471 RepID=UPI001EFC91AA|nr:hypothetical protein [Laribacter hongkongensis]MCG9053516.1 hypothetical protein [Laribacter hongkongensis]